MKKYTIGLLVLGFFAGLSATSIVDSTYDNLDHCYWQCVSSCYTSDSTGWEPIPTTCFECTLERFNLDLDSLAIPPEPAHERNSQFLTISPAI